jgi:hypothetical protein
MYKWLARPDGKAYLPFELKEPYPDTIEELLEALDEANSCASAGQGAGAPSFDHGKRGFEHVNALLQVALKRAARERQQQMIIAIDSSGDCAAAQTAEVIKLTKTLKILTWALVGVGVVQIGLMSGEVKSPTLDHAPDEA